jgi:nitrogen-specific signal transduction histidine kinase
MNYRETLHAPIIPPQVVPLIEKASQSYVPVFIQGEKGTGKELVAKLIHHLGEWKNFRFHRVDCKLIPDGALPQQFAHLFKEVDFLLVPITLYLKEVGHLGPMDQMRLLEMMEDGIFQNGVEKRMVKNLRFIASDCDNLKEKVDQGKFLEELYHRIRTVSIGIPSLRDRAKEIPAIAQYILKEQVRRINIKQVDISPRVLSLFQNYRWPENMRELEHVIIRSAIFSEGATLVEKDLLRGMGNDQGGIVSYLKEAEVSLSPGHERRIAEDQGAQSLMVFFIELIHRIKNPLVSIKTFTQLLREKFNDVEFRDYFYRIVTEDIDKIDSVLNGLLNYIKINTPIQKTGTVHVILEEILKEFEDQLGKRKVRIFKKFEESLPETSIHDEQLRYMLSSILHYAIPSIPPHGSIGFLTKTWDSEKRTSGEAGLVQKDGNFIELLIVFSGTKQVPDPLEPLFGISSEEKGEGIELELRLVKEMIEKHRGMMKFEVNEKKPRTLISLRFPVERRRVVYYSSIHS